MTAAQDNISRQLADLQRSLGRVESMVAEALRDGVDHGARLNKVEKRLAWWSGAGAAIGAIVGYVTKSHAS